MDEYQIVERIKDWYREGHRSWYYVLLNGNSISFVPPPSFHESNKQGQISDRTIGSVGLFGMIRDEITSFEFPMFGNSVEIVEFYVYKRGYVLVDQLHGRYPLPNLKYFIRGVEYGNRLAVELVDLDVVANNLNLPKIMSSVLDPKLLRTDFRTNEITRGAVYRIRDVMYKQKLFAGEPWYSAWGIVHSYFDENRPDFAKKVVEIGIDYERVFRPYRVVYDTKTWEPVLM